jgi:methionyl-tRNA formyltransferase
MKKILVFGCQSITVNLLKFLLKQKNTRISLVVTYELNLDKIYGYLSVIDFCKKKKIQYCKFSEFNENLKKKIEDISPDLIVSSYFRAIIPIEILKLSKICINLHPSYLPQYRGPVPTGWSILNGEKYSGFTLHKVDSGIDTGSIIDRVRFKIREYETGYELYLRSMKIGYSLFKKNFFKIITNNIKYKKQKDCGSYYGKFLVNNNINWKKKSIEIINLIRVFSAPYSTARTRIFNKYLLIDEAKIYKLANYKAQVPGKIFKILGNKIIVTTADGLISLNKYNFFKPFKNKEEKKIYLKIGNKFSDY